MSHCFNLMDFYSFNIVNSNLQDIIIFHYLKRILTPSKILIKERLIKKDKHGR